MTWASILQWNSRMEEKLDKCGYTKLPGMHNIFPVYIKAFLKEKDVLIKEVSTRQRKQLIQSRDNMWLAWWCCTLWHQHPKCPWLEFWLFHILSSSLLMAWKGRGEWTRTWENWKKFQDQSFKLAQLWPLWPFKGMRVGDLSPSSF